MTDEQIRNVEGVTDDHNTFVGAIEYILAFHYPSAVEDGRLKKVMDQFKRPMEPQPGVRPETRGAAAPANSLP